MTDDIYTTAAMTHPSFKHAVLPTELYQEIVVHLDPKHDRRTLLNLALCSHSFRVESQQMIFGNMEMVHGFDRNDQDTRLVWVHAQFLQSVITCPQRLARYVHSYFQYRVALESTCKWVERE